MADKFYDNSKFLFFGKTFNGVQEFADAYVQGDKDQAKNVIEGLLRKGELKIADVKTPEQKCFEQIAQEQEITDAVAALDMEQNMAKDLKAKQKREGRLVYPGIEVTMGTYADAYKLMVYCQSDLRIKDVSINVTTEGSKVTVKNITDAEMNAINRYYTGMKLTNGIQCGMQKGMDTVTKTVDYAAQNVVAPAAQVGIKGVVSIFKSLAKVGAKTTSTLITSTSQGIKSTKEELLTDPDVLRAAGEIIDAKDALKRKTIGGKTANGIKMLSD